MFKTAQQILNGFISRSFFQALEALQKSNLSNGTTEEAISTSQLGGREEVIFQFLTTASFPYYELTATTGGGSSIADGNKRPIAKEDEQADAKPVGRASFQVRKQYRLCKQTHTVQIQRKNLVPVIHGELK